MKLAVLDWYTVNISGDISSERLQKFGEVTIIPMTSPEETAKNIGDAEIVLCNKVVIDRKVMEKCPNIKYIGLFATGFNNIDIECAREKNIVVCNAGSYSTNAVAQQTFAYMLDYFNKVRDYDKAVKNGEWEKFPSFSYFPIPTGELAGKTLAVIGYGSIGRKVAEIASAFGMNVVVNTRTVPENCPYEVMDIISAVRKADVVTFHCPLTEQTRHIINKNLLDNMKSTAILINTSRGGAVNENDLAEALEKGRIAGAYLDVLEKEPMSPDTPLKNARNCVITPHTAWAAYETRNRLVDIVCSNIEAWLEGSPVNKVN